MPIYDYKCQECGRVHEHYAKIDQAVMPCDECAGIAKRMITARYSVIPDLQPYWDPHIGKEPVYITSKKHREQVMRREGVAELVGKGWI